MRGQCSPNPPSSRSHGPRRGSARSNPLSGEPLTDHVELIERGIAQRQRSALCAVRHAHRKPEQIAELMFERGEIGVTARPTAATFRLVLRATCQPFGIAHRQSSCDYLVGECLDVIRTDQRTGVTHRQCAGRHTFLDGAWQFEQPQEIGDVAARFVDKSSKCVLRMPEILDQPVIRLGLLDRIEVLPLDILDRRSCAR